LIVFATAAVAATLCDPLVPTIVPRLAFIRASLGFAVGFVVLPAVSAVNSVYSAGATLALAVLPLPAPSAALGSTATTVTGATEQLCEVVSEDAAYVVGTVGLTLLGARHCLQRTALAWLVGSTTAGHGLQAGRGWGMATQRSRPGSFQLAALSGETV
jgi:hypothetical protein